jgi:hypothetical protein
MCKKLHLQTARTFQIAKGRKHTMTVRLCTLSAVFFNFLCELDLLGIGAGAVKILIEEGVRIISDNVADLTLGKSKTRVNGVQLISKVDSAINVDLS